MCILAVSAAGCTAPETPDPAERQAKLEARLGAADCASLRETMTQAVVAQADPASATRTAGSGADGADGADGANVARVATMFVPIPGLGLLRRAATAAARAEREAETAGMADPETVYRTAHATYAAKACAPALPYWPF